MDVQTRVTERRPGPRSRDIPPAPVRLDSRPARVDVFHSFGAVEALWREAQEHSACFGFQTYEWLSTWYETIGATLRIEPRIVHLADASGATLMLLPLGLRRRLSLRFLVFLGGGITDYHAPLVRPDFAASLDAAAADRLLRDVLRRLGPVDVIELERMPETFDEVANPFARLPDARHVADAYAATLCDTFADFKKRRSAKFFSDAGRKWRRLADIGEPRFEIADSLEARTEILRALARQKRQQGREIGFPDPFEKPGHLAFYETMARRHASTGLVQLSALRVGGTIVATHWGLVFRERFYWLMPSYESGPWARFSTGRLLMQRLLEWGIDSKLKLFDLTVGDEAYKSLWADRTLPLYKCVRGVTWKGKAYRELDLRSAQLKEWAKRRAWLRRLVRDLRRRLLSTFGRSTEPTAGSSEGG